MWGYIQKQIFVAVLRFPIIQIWEISTLLHSAEVDGDSSDIAFVRFRIQKPATFSACRAHSRRPGGLREVHAGSTR